MSNTMQKVKVFNINDNLIFRYHYQSEHACMQIYFDTNNTQRYRILHSCMLMITFNVLINFILQYQK